MDALTVVRWKRYGKDRLYVNDEDGARVGWRDLVTGQSLVERPELRAEFDAAIAEWELSEGAPQPLPGEAPSAPAPPPSTQTERTPESAAAPAEAMTAGAGTAGSPPVLDGAAPAEEWFDLATNKAGVGPRAHAIAHRDAAPVRTLLARVLHVHTDERAWRVGAVGEEKVAAQLAKLGPRWRVLHGIPVGQRGSDIDHVVIGPAGVFTLNAKRHIDAKIWVGGGTFLVNGHRQPYVPKSEREAARASLFISRSCGFPVVVRGVVVPVDAAEILIKSQPDSVHIVNRMRLRQWLQGLPDLLDAATVEAIFEAARRSTTWA
jgi:hypothetical protein